MLSDIDICGLLLAGGRSRRMGGRDKCLMTLSNRSLLNHIVVAARPQVGPMVLNTNSDPSLFSDYALPVVSDVIDGYAGPLAGILTGLEWALQYAPNCKWVASFACDAPFVPINLVERLRQAVYKQGADIGCAASGGRLHPVFALWPVCLAPALRDAVEREGLRKVDEWTERYVQARVEFPVAPYDPFFNINRLEDLAEAEAMLAARPTGKIGL